eukprot:6159999-Pyramimonas_sp.AAC.1
MTIDDMLASQSCETFLKDCPYESLKAQVIQKVAMRDAITKLGIDFGRTDASPSDQLQALLGDLTAAGTTC